MLCVAASLQCWKVKAFGAVHFRLSGVLWLRPARPSMLTTCCHLLPRHTAVHLAAFRSAHLHCTAQAAGLLHVGTCPAAGRPALLQHDSGGAGALCGSICRLPRGQVWAGAHRPAAAAVAVSSCCTVHRLLCCMQLACCCHSAAAGVRPRHCRMLLLRCLLLRLLQQPLAPRCQPRHRNTVLGRWDADTSRFLTEEECVGELACRQHRVQSCETAKTRVVRSAIAAAPAAAVGRVRAPPCADGSDCSRFDRCPADAAALAPPGKEAMMREAYGFLARQVGAAH